MHTLLNPPISAHPTELSGRLQESLGVRNDYCGEGGEDNLIKNQWCYLVMASYNLPDNTFHVAQNNFKVEHEPPYGKRFDMI